VEVRAMTLNHRYCRAYLFSFLAILFYCQGLLGVAQKAPPRQREVEIAALALSNPIQFTRVMDLGNSYAVPRSNHQVVTFLDGSPDWIGNVSITIENHTTKRIIAIKAMVSVPAWDPDLFHMSYFIYFHEGQLPEHALHLGDGTPIPEESSMVLDVIPGGSGTIPFKQAFTKLIAKNRPSTAVPLASVDRIRVQLDGIFFSDGTEWAYGTYLKPDASAPAHYVPISPEEWKSYK
jgi:hypothetical protein